MAASGMTVLLTTHYMEEASRLADRLIVIADGEILADTTPGELRGRAGQMAVRFPLPPSAPAASLPARLASDFDSARGQINVHTNDVATVLKELIGWAQPLGLSLDRLDALVLACWLAGGLLAARVLFRWQPTRRATARPGRRAKMN